MRLRPKLKEIGLSAVMVPVEIQQSQGYAQDRGTRAKKTWCRSRPT
jgi:hypothetical protein